MTEWNIQSRAQKCSACGKTFADKEVYHTLLFEDKAGFRRSDVCLDCWQKEGGEDNRDRKGFISYWQGVYEAPAPAAPEAIQKDTAESLLRKLIERNEPQDAAAGYILAVMLERKRLLRVKEQLVREGRRVFIYEQPKSGDLFTIVDPELQLNQLESIQRQVADLLEHGLSASVSTPAPEAAVVSAPPEAPAETPTATPGLSEPPSEPAGSEPADSVEPTPATE